MAKVVDQIKSEGVSCIFYDPLEGDKMAQAVANEADIQALPLFYTFEGDSESRDYVTVMKANLEELKKGFKMKASKQISESLPIMILLTLSGGFMDAYSYLCRGEVFCKCADG